MIYQTVELNPNDPIETVSVNEAIHKIRGTAVVNKKLDLVGNGFRLSQISDVRSCVLS